MTLKRNSYFLLYLSGMPKPDRSVWYKFRKNEKEYLFCSFNVGSAQHFQRLEETLIMVIFQNFEESESEVFTSDTSK